MNKFKTTALAAALVATSGPASSAVIAANDGWEVSFGGFINLFANFYSNDRGEENSEVHLQEGFLPAFATFKAISPEMNGLRGTAQISFAPDSSASKSRRQDRGGGGGAGDVSSAIDMREVFFNVEGSFGTFSAGRTLGIFGRSAILKDMTLFGVGAGGNEGLGGGGTTLGRIGHGYVYPAFDTRFSYKTPDMGGFQVEIGAYDPFEKVGGGSGTTETSIPRIEAEATYTSTFDHFGGGSMNFWLGGLWQESDDWETNGNDVTSWGYDVGVDATLGNFNAVGHYMGGKNLSFGTLFKVDAPSTDRSDYEDTHWYGQLSYTFMGKTKLGVSYGRSEIDFKGDTANSFGITSGGKVSNHLLSVGVYHDVNSWLKLVGEYNDVTTDILDQKYNSFSVGGFIFW